MTIDKPLFPYCNADNTTPRTDEAYEDACGDVDREIQDGWDLARKLEKELIELRRGRPKYSPFVKKRCRCSEPF